jgi:CDP-glucose 4,6-dehydratase
MKLSFYRDKRVFITGHTGFKGSWMCRLLHNLGAKVYGYALEPPTVPSLFKLNGIEKDIVSTIGDIRDLELLKKSMRDADPEIIIHMAAQPIVRESYVDPVGTYSTNVMGTVNLLEAARYCDSVRSIINVTTDKVYKNFEWERGYIEDDILDGHDPYSNSKSCSELVTSSYKKAFFKETEVPITTCRAGNVIGGGDFAKDRIIPDCVRAMEEKRSIIVRNPYSTRPYQHVLEPVYAYLMIAAKQYEKPVLSGCYNVGPEDFDCVTTGEIVDLFCKHWPGAEWKNISEINAPHEANFLKLNCDKIKKTFGWHPRWNVDKAVAKTVEWSRVYLEKGNFNAVMDAQIEEFLR